MSMEAWKGASLGIDEEEILAEAETNILAYISHK
jgi:hypothetical protein